MNAPVILCPEFIGVMRHLINTPPFRENLSIEGRALFYVVTSSRLLQKFLPDYDKDLEARTKILMGAIDVC